MRALTLLFMGFHVPSEQAIDLRLISPPPATKPLEDISVNADGDGLFDRGTPSRSAEE